jgi:hypothetical protein
VNLEKKEATDTAPSSPPSAGVESPAESAILSPPESVIVSPAEFDHMIHPAWYALYTRSRHEKKLLGELTDRSIDVFLPMREVLSRWKDRKKRIWLHLRAPGRYAGEPIQGAQHARRGALHRARRPR